jgi:acyl carrier protein
MACSSLKNNECDMALAGGVSLFNKYGYLYQEDMIESPDGYCRAFDIDAKGTVAGSGVGVIVLKRLSDAIQQGDKIYAVIKGGAVNNDGSSKIGYTAPSISGQERVIQKALKNAGANPDTIGYIEAHGTGTQLGDPIELRALHNIYEQYLDQSKGCVIGSVKTNIGHTDAAAGILGLIKTVLILKNKIIPATLHFKQFNPEISAFNKIFFVPNKSIYWESDENLRRAAISSFGIGGTNAHLILEEYLEPERIKAESKPVLIPFSAKNQKSLWTKANQLKQYLHSFGKANFLNDIAFTAQEGRAEFQERGYFVVKSSLKEKSVCIKEFFIRDHVFYEKLQWIYILAPENTISAYSLAIQLKFLHWLCSVGVPPNGIVLSENIANKEFASIRPEIDLLKIKIFNHVDNIIQDSTMESIFVEIGPDITLDEKCVLRRTILSGDQDDHNLAYLNLIGWLWSHGIWIPWNKIDPSSFINNKIAIPSYVFNRKLYEVPKIKSESKLISDEIISTEIKVSPEFQLKKVWSEVLGVSSIDLNQKTDFFDLGGDSLALIDILERMKRKFLCDITLEEIMMNCEFGSMVNLFTSKIKEKCE